MPDDTPDTRRGVFDKLAGRAKQTIGNLTGNQTLADEGELQERKAHTAEQAARLTAEAEQAEREAELTAEEEENRLEQARVQAELAELSRTDEIERTEATERARVVAEAARQKTAAAQQEQASLESLDRQEADAVAERIDGAQKASELDQDARRAERTADALDAAHQNLDQTTGA